MAGVDSHGIFVDAWMERVAAGLPSELLAQLFERAVDSLWRRCHATLGDVTLHAIFDRVLDQACQHFPCLASLELSPTGVCWYHFRERARDLGSDHLSRGVRFVLVHFLELLGSLTAEVLTPALHAELSQVTLAEPPDGPPASTDEPDREVKP